MRRLPSSLNLFLRGLLLALAVHGGILIFFTFTMTLRESSARPDIHFLGSILNTDDLSVRRMRAGKDHAAFQTEQITAAAIMERLSSLSTLELPKPAHFKPASSRQQPSKTLFLDQREKADEDRKERPVSEPLLELPQETPAYRPLRWEAQ